MKFDFADLEENYTPRDIPVELGITREDIYESWNKVLKTYGGRWLRYPIVTYDPDIPVHFGISMNWRVLFNLAYLPPNLPKDKILWWIEHLPIQHEFGHYHICPYSGSDIARYIAIVKKMKPLLSRQHVFYILNFFSDLLVNYTLWTELHQEFQSALQYWFEWQNSLCQNNNVGHSHSWNMFVRIHEFIWKTTPSIVNVLPDQESRCKKIAKLIIHKTPDDDLLRYITKHLLAYFEEDLQQNQPMIDIEQLSFQSGVNDLQIPDLPFSFPTPPSNSPNNNENTDSNDTDSEPPDAENDDSDTQTQKSSSQPIAIKVNGKLVPFDMVETCGNPFDEKYLSKVADRDPTTEQQQSVDSLISSLNNENSTGRGVSPIQLLEDFLVANKHEALRMWFRYQASNLFQYNVTEKKPISQFPCGVTNWEYSDLPSEWSIPLSISSNPLFPYVPFAKKWRTGYGVSGKGVPAYRDIFIITDSSGSMDGISRNIYQKLTTRTDHAVLTGFGLLHSALKKNVQFRILNFSDRIYMTNWLSNSPANIREAEDTLMHLQSGGTTVPFVTIINGIRTHPNCLLVFITDLELGNVGSLPTFLENVKHVPIIFFHIGSSGGYDSLSILSQYKNVYYYPIKNLASMLSISVELAHKYYIDTPTEPKTS